MAPISIGAFAVGIVSFGACAVGILAVGGFGFGILALAPFAVGFVRTFIAMGDDIVLLLSSNMQRAVRQTLLLSSQASSDGTLDRDER